MPFLKRTLVAIGTILLIAFGGSSTQSSNLFLQGTGVIALLVAVVILIIFARMMWRAAGCLLSSLIMGGIIVFMVFAIGGFSGGIKKTPEKIKSFLGQSSGAISTKNTVPNEPMLMGTLPSPQKTKEPTKQPQTQKKQGFNPMDYPSVSAPVEVVKANVLRYSNGRSLRLFGIDAPDLNQTCANKQGRAYFCGKQAGLWLKKWIGNYNLKCHVLTTDEQNNLIGVCFLGEYDIAAALTNAGWAVASPEGKGVYQAYEDIANQQRRGLWQGQFYKPADWRLIKSQKSEIKVIKAKKKSKIGGFFGF